MRFSPAKGALISLLMIGVSAIVDAQFQPECAAWDQLIRTISHNVRAIPMATAQCSRSTDCTRFACKFLMFRKNIIFDIKLFPCTTPAQMRLLVLSNADNVYFEQTVMHRNTYPIPGLTYNIIPGMRLQLSVQVHFQKLAAGLEIGLRLKFSGPTPLITFSYPIFPDYIIPVRDCTAAVSPAQHHCTQMNRTVTALAVPPDHSCHMVKDCGGLSCVGALYASSRPQAHPGVPYNISLVMDGCDSPLSYTLTISTSAGKWNYKFFRSKEVLVNLTLSPGSASLFANLVMQPALNLETMTTSLTLRSCFHPLPCSRITLMDKIALPIPPCSSAVPTGSTPTLGTTPLIPDECLVWQRVENELIQSAGPGYGITSCTTIDNCSGYNCTGEFEGHYYTIVTVLKHCLHPIQLRMRVRSFSDRFYWEQDITHNDNITVAGTSGMLGFHIHLLKLSNRQVLVGVYAQVGLPGLSPLSVPLIQDQVMPVSQCQGNTKPGQGGGNNGGGLQGGQPQQPNGGRPTKSPVKNMKMRAGASVGIGLTIGVGIAALVATVMIYIYYRRFPSQDRVILVHRASPPRTSQTL